MSAQTTPEQKPQTTVGLDWEPPMPPTDLIFDDGEPLETNRHRIAMNTLIRSLQQAWSDRNDFFAGGNMFIYYSSAQARNRDFRGPDFFAVLDIDGSYPRQGWVVWEEDGRYPDVIVELLSKSTAEADTGTKLDLDQALKTSFKIVCCTTATLFAVQSSQLLEFRIGRLVARHLYAGFCNYRFGLEKIEKMHEELANTHPVGHRPCIILCT